MRIPPTGYEPAAPVQADGTIPAASGRGWTLLAGQTYYAQLGGADASQLSVLLHGASALVLTSVKLEVANSDTPTELSVTAGDWFETDPADAVVEVTGNCTESGVDVAKTAGAVGTALISLPTFPWRRGRLAIVVGVAGGVLVLDCQAKG
jgi:hypothetical protein